MRPCTLVRICDECNYGSYQVEKYFSIKNILGGVTQFLVNQDKEGTIIPTYHGAGGQKTVFGGIISSGWLTALVWLRLMHKAFLCYETTLGSPGHEEMIWPTPVRPGDQLSGQVEVKESRVSKSKPDLGLVRYISKLSNQEGEEVFVTTSTMIVKPRPAQRS